MYELEVKNYKLMHQKSSCLYDEMKKNCLKLLKKYNKQKFKFKKNIYIILDKHLRTSGICNPEMHMGRGLQTAQTITKYFIKNNIININKI